MAALELPYVNWRSAAAPIDTRPLVLRRDAKGDGAFLAGRSGRRLHRGVDLVAEIGSPVRAIRSGSVAQVGMHRGLGRFIEMEHDRSWRSLYAHLSEASVQVGQRVRQGQAIGTVGKTGNARHLWILPHLHVEVLRQGVPVDPRVLGLQIVEPVSADSRRASETVDGVSVNARGGE